MRAMEKNVSSVSRISSMFNAKVRTAKNVNFLK